MEGFGRVVVGSAAIASVVIGSAVGGLLGAAAFFAVDAYVAKASSEPVYLRCNVPKSSSPIWDLTLDEKAGTVAVYMPLSGVSNTNDATFTRDEIRWTRPFPRLSLKSVFLLNRTTGEIVRHVSGLDTAPSYGTCAIKKVPTDRMF